MKQSESTRSIFPIASLLSMSILWLAFVLPGTGVVSGGVLGLLSLTVALWAMRPVPTPVPAKPVL